MEYRTIEAMELEIERLLRRLDAAAELGGVRGLLSSGFYAGQINDLQAEIDRRRASEAAATASRFLNDAYVRSFAA